MSCLPRWPLCPGGAAHESPVGGWVVPGSRSQGEKGWGPETRPDAWGRWKPLEEPGSLTCPGAAVCSGPSLRCSGSALTNRCGRGCSVTRALCAVPVCPALQNPGGACPREPHALGGVCELVSSLCSWHGAAQHLPHGHHWGRRNERLRVPEAPPGPGREQ